MNAEKRISRLWVGATACFLALVSASSFGVHLDKIFKDEAEAYASPSWECTYLGVFPTFNPGGPNNAFSGILLQGPLGSAMNVEACLASAQTKVVEMADAWKAEINRFALPGADPRCPAPVRELECFKGTKTQIADPVTGLPIDVYPYNCAGQYVSTCVMYLQGSPTYVVSHQHGNLPGLISGHPPAYPGGPYYGGGLFIHANACSVPDLLPKPTDACSVELEAGKGKVLSVGSACPLPEIMTDPRGHQCFKDKVDALGLTNAPYNGPTATIRTAAYQAHLEDLWDKNIRHGRITDPTMKALCAERKAKVDTEISVHGLTDKPAGRGHELGRAFDVSNATVNEIESTLLGAGRSIFGLILTPPPCNLQWGGYYPNTIDRVHFYR